LRETIPPIFHRITLKSALQQFVANIAPDSEPDAVKPLKYNKPEINLHVNAGGRKERPTRRQAKKER
jgi:hypothetical protein